MEYFLFIYQEREIPYERIRKLYTDLKEREVCQTYFSVEIGAVKKVALPPFSIEYAHASIWTPLPLEWLSLTAS